MAPGIIWVASAIKNPDTLNDETFNKWYTDIHLGDVLGSGVPNFALRYKNVAPNKQYPYVALYHFPDLDGMAKKEFHEVPTTSDLLGGTNDWRTELNTDIRVYELIQTLEGAKSSSAGRAPVLSTIFMNVPAENDAEFDKWYREEHLDLLSKCTGFIRATRYKLLDPSPYNDANPIKPLPKWATIYEWESTNMPMDEITTASSTEWSKKMLPLLKNVETELWTYVSEQKGKGVTDSVPRLGKL